MKSNRYFTVCRSSAGSGKTYTLVRSYLGIALLRPDDFRNILAITFTNKAANEMKSRVIDYLEALANPETHKDSVAIRHLLPELIDDTGLDQRQILERAGYLLNKLFHDYADFSIGTIDSFMHRVVRSFAFDLHRPVDFEATLEQDVLLEEVAELLVSRAGSDPQVTRALVELVENKAGEDKSWNIEKDLIQTGKLLFEDEGIEYLPVLKNLDIPAYLGARQEIRKFSAVFEHSLVDAATAAMQAINREGLQGHHFYQATKGIYGYFERLSEGEFDKAVPGSYALKSYSEDKWSSPKVSPSEQAAIDCIIPELRSAFGTIRSLIERDHSRYILYRLLENNLLVTALIGAMDQELDSMKADRKLMPISEFNRLIYAIVRQQPAPFIYERLGERYHHYLIDEFQDTSTLQWQNILPLVENALSGGHVNLVVGDGKQAIYRWRSGDVEQFQMLPKVPGSGHDALLRQREAALTRNFNPVTLTRNFRSFGEVVNFNNRFYEYARRFIPENYRSVYDDVSQDSNKGSTGLVSVEFIEGGRTKAEFRQKVFERLPALVDELCAGGFSLRDITMLFRKGMEASETAAMLLSRGISVISSESLLLKHSPKVLFLIHWFRILADPSDQVSLAGILTYLWQEQDPAASGLDDHLVKFREMKADHKAAFSGRDLLDPILEARDEKISVSELKSLDLVSMTESLIRVFALNVPADPYLQFFQDAVLGFAGKNLAQVADFLEWWETKSGNLSIVVPEGLDAIRIMTIHKAKGLEFPVVILPLATEEHSLTHEQQWIRLTGNEMPPIEAVYLPLAKDLEKTDYHEAREIESDKSYLDMVNLMYVATTRAIERLYILTKVVKEVREMPNGFPQLLAGFMKEEGRWTGSEQKLEFGLAEGPKITKPVDAIERISLPSYISAEWRPKVRLRLQASRAWDIENPENNREWGNLLHAAMASISVPADLDPVLDDMAGQGMMDGARKAKMAEIIGKILIMPEISRFFDGSYEVINEQEIIGKEGRLFRPDRLMIRGREAMVIDYKTGSEHPGYKQQLRQYAGLLEDLGYIVKGAWLLFMGEIPRLVKVA